MDASAALLYEERLTSKRTEALFRALTVLFVLLSIWRVVVRGLDGLAIVLILLAAFFLFYAINYRTLIVRLAADALRLKFGLFTWTVRIDNVEDCGVDDVPLVMRMGGAGIHFMFVRGRYRVSFNVLEYPRVVLALKKKAGPVCDVSFSTRQPDEVVQRVRQQMAAQ